VDELYDEDSFLLTIPLWMLAQPVAPSQSLVMLTGPAEEKASPIFTDQDLAERFRAWLPGAAAKTSAAYGAASSSTPTSGARESGFPVSSECDLPRSSSHGFLVGKYPTPGTGQPR
jgi:hypothetical protein